MLALDVGLKLNKGKTKVDVDRSRQALVRVRLI